MCSILLMVYNRTPSWRMAWYEQMSKGISFKNIANPCRAYIWCTVLRQAGVSQDEIGYNLVYVYLYIEYLCMLRTDGRWEPCLGCTIVRHTVGWWLAKQRCIQYVFNYIYCVLTYDTNKTTVHEIHGRQGNFYVVCTAITKICALHKFSTINLSHLFPWTLISCDKQTVVYATVCWLRKQHDEDAKASNGDDGLNWRLFSQNRLCWRR